MCSNLYETGVASVDFQFTIPMAEYGPVESGQAYVGPGRLFQCAPKAPHFNPVQSGLVYYIHYAMVVQYSVGGEFSGV